MRYASITSRLAGLGSGKWALHIRARQLKASGADVIELTIGEPDVAPDRALLDECRRALHAGRYRYSNGRGEPSVVGEDGAVGARRLEPGQAAQVAVGKAFVVAASATPMRTVPLEVDDARIPLRFAGQVDRTTHSPSTDLP